MERDNQRDWALLRKYAADRSETAFSVLVNRHVQHVYATCRREVGDPWLAEDVTQVVFLILARKAPLMLPGTIVSRWLFKTARFASRDIARRENNRRKYEQEGLERQTVSRGCG